VKRQLAIGDSTIVFTAKDGRELISAPVEQITDAHDFVPDRSRQLTETPDRVEAGDAQSHDSSP
jgi:hypothetical protein